jgi:DeoR/GlpR family transcriptional regulator of sugar metabolism
MTSHFLCVNTRFRHNQLYIILNQNSPQFRWRFGISDNHIHIIPSRNQQQIGKAAAVLVQDGQTVLLAGGTTCFAAASYLRLRRVSVVTNSLPAASHLGETLGVDIQVTGGLVYPKHDILIGPQLKQSLQQVQTADWLFLSGSGCDADGFYDANHLEIEAQRELMQRATRVALLIDSTKIAKRDLLLVANWNDVHMLITDEEPPADLRRILNKNQVKLIVAKE